MIRLPLSIAAIALSLSLSGCGSGKDPNAAPPPAEVGVVKMTTQPVTTTADLTGRTVAMTTAEVRPQIEGIIQARLFKEGSYVRAGQPLYQIDSRLYRAARDQAAAQLANAQAASATAQAKAERYSNLLKSDAVAKQDVDDAIAAARQAKATVAQYRAALHSANVNLGFTRIRAPISGRIGKSNYTKGALVTAAQTNALANISQLDPIYVDLEQSSVALLNLRQSLSKNGVLPATATVTLTLENGERYPMTGTVEFGEVTVDPDTGTVSLRARFPNPERLLLPGMFVTVSAPQTVIEKGILAPQQGVSRDAKGNATALVVGPDNKVVLRNLTIAQAVGNKWLVTSGLKSGDRLIVEGVDKAQPGATVKPVLVKTGS